MLRLEDLFLRIARFVSSDESADHHAALGVLFEILEVASRADLKSELLQELERQKKILNALHNNPQIAEDALDAILNQIEDDSTRLLEMSGKIGQHLRDDEWLMGIKQRACIPGGVCEFDLPSYHYWQHQSAEVRRADLGNWITPLLPLRNGISILLKLMRESGKLHHFVAHQGTFQQMQGGRVAQLLRVSLDQTLPCVPEVSANKYALNIRFVAANFTAKTTLYEQDVEFDLTFCSSQ
jgi:cell division protein ZapD